MRNNMAYDAFPCSAPAPKRYSLNEKSLRFFRPILIPKERKTMKTTIVRLILAALLLLACGLTPVLPNGPGDPPLCFPGQPGCSG